MEYRLITAVSGFPCLYDRSSPTYRDLNMRSDALEGGVPAGGGQRARLQAEVEDAPGPAPPRALQGAGGGATTGVGAAQLPALEVRGHPVLPQPLHRLQGRRDQRLGPGAPGRPAGPAVRDHDAGGDVPGRVAGRAALLALRRRRLAAAEDRGAGRQRRRAAGAHRRRGRVAPGGRAAAGGPPTARWRTGPGARSPGGTRGWSSRDHVTLFLLSLAPAVRRLPAEKQSWLKTKIQQLVHEAEFGPTSFQ
uniref:BESS domain-containing protein n=1 Tax=Tetraodon nigroviridis TaxID=99883 RepID=H3CAW6_TETNG